MSTFALKLFALVTMLIDHMGEYFPEVFPIWFRWIGRLSAPIFLFCAMEGIRHTSNRKLYLIRMYGFSLGMGIADTVLNNLFPDARHPVYNNIFSSIFLIAMIICVAEWIRGNAPNPEDPINLPLKKPPIRTAVWTIFIFVSLQVLVSAVWISLIGAGYINDAIFLNGLIPSLLGVEGSIFFVVLGLLMYATGGDIPNGKRNAFIATYALMCICQAAPLFQGAALEVLFMQAFQWMMIASLPFMLCYNGKKGKSGRGWKYLFYFFYPVHVIALFLLSVLYQQRTGLI